jgi:hypothetical protein
MRNLLLCAALLVPAAADAQSADAAAMEKCAGDWERYAEGMRHSRQQAERRRQGGGEMSKADKKEQLALEELSARFLPACGKYGFEAPGEPRAELRNHAVAKELRQKTGTRPPPK